MAHLVVYPVLDVLVVETINCSLTTDCSRSVYSHRAKDKDCPGLIFCLVYFHL